MRPLKAIILIVLFFVVAKSSDMYFDEDTGPKFDVKFVDYDEFDMIIADVKKEELVVMNSNGKQYDCFIPSPQEEKEEEKERDFSIDLKPFFSGLKGNCLYRVQYPSFHFFLLFN